MTPGILWTGIMSKSTEPLKEKTRMTCTNRNESHNRHYLVALACEQARLFGVSRASILAAGPHLRAAKVGEENGDKPILLAGSQIAAPPPRYSHETPNK